MCAAVSRVVDALKDTDLWDNTYLVFLSDNGACFQAGGLNTPYRGTKKHLFEGALPPPLHNDHIRHPLPLTDPLLRPLVSCHDLLSLDNPP